MSERQGWAPTPDVLRPPQYFENKEIAQTNRLIDMVLRPAHERIGLFTQGKNEIRTVRSDGTAKLARSQLVSPDGEAMHVQRLGFASHLDTAEEPFRAMTYDIWHERTCTMYRNELEAATLEQMYQTFQKQYDAGRLSGADYRDVFNAPMLILSERHYYTLHAGQQAKRSFSTQLRVRHEPLLDGGLPEYSMATLMSLENNTQHNFPEHPELKALDADATLGLLGGDTVHEKRLLSVLYDLGLISSDELEQYAAH